ncbi:MAG: helix-turn-helix transcriptional regulator [Cytophagales bacterium]|nr:helix-turn-helix transcriptional regulator [Cytophagales bacterium]
MLASRITQMTLKIENKKLFLISVTSVIVICVLTFNVVYFSTYYGFVQINYLNSLFLVPFILIVLSLGMLIEQNKSKESLRKIETFELTPKEVEVATLMLEEKKNKEIADELFVELSTIKTHINAIYKKIGVKNRNELIRKISD